MTKCPWTTFSCDLQLNITRQPKFGSMIHQIHWSPRISFPLVTLSSTFALPSDSIVHNFRKLGFCSISFNATLALVGQLWKNFLRASLGGVPMSTLDIHTYRSQGNAIFLLYLVFRSWTESDQVSLNDIFMRLATQHNSEIEVWIYESSTPLVS